MSKVAVLGIGGMGAAIATELIAAGHEVTIWNRTTERSLELALKISDPKLTIAANTVESVVGHDFVITMMLNGQVTEQALLGQSEVMELATPGTIFIDMGTSGVQAAKKLSAAITAAGHKFIDAPVSGSLATIKAHQILVMASGDSDAISAATPMLAAFAKKVIDLGAAGSGQIMKLAVNSIVHSLNTAISESLALAMAGGIDPIRAYDVLEESVVAAPFLKYKRSAFLDPKPPVAMKLGTVLKDLDLILQLAASLEVSLPAVDANSKIYAAAIAAGFGEADMSKLVETYK